MQTTTISAGTNDAPDDDHQYRQFLEQVRQRFTAATSGLTLADLFITNATDLFATFLAALPAERRQHYTCRSCQRFVETFGGVVTITPEGSIRSLFWDPDTAPPFFEPAVRALARLVARAQITGAFRAAETTWGIPSNASKKAPFEWHHLAVVPPPALVYRPTALLTTEGAAAAVAHEHEVLCRSLAELPIEAVRQAHTWLTNGQLYRSDRHVAPAAWLLALHEARAAATPAERARITWRAAATAPPGFCHARNTMIGTLLEDIIAGLPFDDIKRKFDAKMAPTLYQRPQAAPAAGAIAAAERIVAELGLAPSLPRRFLRDDEVLAAGVALWTPRPPAAPSGKPGVFAHIKPKGATPTTPIDSPPITMTWVKFESTVLPGAAKVEFLTASEADGFFALVTAVNPDAPPLLQWDRPERRNPVSWYFYEKGSAPSRWNLTSNTWHEVTAIVPQPSAWYGAVAEHQGAGVFFLLRGARDLGYESGAGFFPETLRSELHPVRSVMEAHAKQDVVAGAATMSAGIALQRGGKWRHRFRVTDAHGMSSVYQLDRWD